MGHRKLRRANPKVGAPRFGAMSCGAGNHMQLTMLPVRG
jgi:hypothetical protein